MSDDGFNDVRLAQLMASRLCHDLVGPLGAINAGLEMAGEASAAGAADADALALAAKSADQLTRKLTFLRVAFGAGASGGHDPLAEARALSEKLLAGGPVQLDWTLTADGIGASPEVAPKAGLLAKLALNMVLIGAEALARGGVMRVGAPPAAGGFALEVEASGAKVLLKDELAQALSAENGENPGSSGNLERIGARAVQGFFCRRLAATLGGGLEMAREEGRLALWAGPFLLTS